MLVPGFQQVVTTRAVPAGVYHVELINAGVRLGIQKLVVQPPY